HQEGCCTSNRIRDCRRLTGMLSVLILFGHGNREETMQNRAKARGHAHAGRTGRAAALMLLTRLGTAVAQEPRIVNADTQSDALAPGIKLFVREKMAEGTTRFTDENVVLFLHGATAPSTCDFDLSYKDYSWADWMAKRGYVVFMGDYRNYGFST